MGNRVLLAMSGGVDSSVAACLLRERGYEVIGLFMRNGVHEPQSCSTGLPALPVIATGGGHKRGCCSAADAADARRVAHKLDIGFYAVDFAREFDRIMNYFVAEYTAGRTPNPCVMCNNWLKFGRLSEYAQEIGADYVATGHYARVERKAPGLFAHPSATPSSESQERQKGPDSSEYQLLRGADPAKDQSYVLFGIMREILPYLLFPVGEYSKAQIRAMARRLGLRVAEKPDSQEICFVPEGDYLGFIGRRRPGFDGSGEIVDTAGNVLGRHQGFEGYTIGQRKGLGVALGERRYVVQIDAQRRRVVIGSREDLLRSTLQAERVNWLCDRPARPMRCMVKIRYMHQAAPATVIAQPDDQVFVEFDKPESAITPGQAAVFYQGQRVLGGGYIR